jgi:hypothetical protein
MEEKDRWAIHVEYLKVAIALATALIAAAAAIYVDASKIPTDCSRYFLLAGVGAFVLTLFCSVYSVATLASHFINLPRAGVVEPAADAAEGIALREARTRRANRVVGWASGSFVFLFLGAALLAVFFGIRTFDAGSTFDRAIATANAASAKLIDPNKGESEKLKSVEAQTDTYRLTYEVSPGGANIIVITDWLGTNMKSVARH